MLGCFFFNQKTAYEMRISDWSSDVCSSDLGEAGFDDRHVRDLPALLREGDLLVFNDTRVIPARLFGSKAGSGGRVEILIERLQPGTEAREQVGASKPPKAGRSEERRVGKECVSSWRSGRSADHIKKKIK